MVLGCWWERTVSQLNGEHRFVSRLLQRDIREYVDTELYVQSSAKDWVKTLQLVQIYKR